MSTKLLLIPHNIFFRQKYTEGPKRTEKSMSEVITDLQVRIVTSDIHLAGTDNDVYFDIGPLGWELPGSGGATTSSDDPFSQGSDDTFTLDVHNLALTTDDIVWLRLQKKGIGGVLGTGGGIDGDWHPHSIQLKVNGTEYASSTIDQWITGENWYWMHVLRSSDTAEERFARTLRIVPNNVLSGRDESVAFLTTPFKILGISGWFPTGLPIICAIGTVMRVPGRSTDGLATIDLRLKTVQFNDRIYILDGNHEINHTRYLRVEYKFRAPFPKASGENYVPQNGEYVRICGDMEWDSDQEGWYEIHPRNSDDVPTYSTTLTLRQFLEICGFDPSQGLRPHLLLAG